MLGLLRKCTQVLERKFRSFCFLPCFLFDFIEKNVRNGCIRFTVVFLLLESNFLHRYKKIEFLIFLVLRSSDCLLLFYLFVVVNCNWPCSWSFSYVISRLWSIIIIIIFFFCGDHLKHELYLLKTKKQTKQKWCLQF